jgi:hypothetical protein
MIRKFIAEYHVTIIRAVWVTAWSIGMFRFYRGYPEFTFNTKVMVGICMLGVAWIGYKAMLWSVRDFLKIGRPHGD